jgi:hypothetical protein
MSLTKDELKQIKELMVESEARARNRLSGEMKLLNDVQSDRLYNKINEELKTLEYALRDEIQYNRREIQSVRNSVEGLRKDIEDVNENRTEDIDDAFTDIIKNTEDIKDLDGRVFKLETQAAH